MDVTSAKRASASGAVTSLRSSWKSATATGVAAASAGVGSRSDVVASAQRHSAQSKPPVAPAAPPPPPSVSAPASASDVTRTKSGKRVVRPKFEPKLDPREELMIAIRNAGKTPLKKVGATTAQT